MIDVERIPVELRQRPQWVLWKAETRPGDPKPTKVPYETDKRSKAKSTDSSTWTTFEAALAAFKTGGCDGLGYVFSGEPGDFSGVDLDDCLENRRLRPWTPEQRACKHWATDAPDPETIVSTLASYAEVSPSGAGVKLIVRGDVPVNPSSSNGARGWKRGDIEFYQDSRYFTVTGDHLPGTPSDIRDCNGELAHIVAKFTSGRKTNIPVSSGSVSGAARDFDDRWIADKAIAVRGGEKFRALMEGNIDGYPSPSEADSALACKLAFWTRDAAQIKRIMLSSGLVREKWENNREYLDRTISNALKTVTETYSPGRPRDEPPADIDLTDDPAATTEPVFDEDTGQFRHAAPPGDKPTVEYKLMTSAELDAAEFDIEFLVEWLLVAGQPCILFGPQKSLKTSVLIDLMLSLAWGGRFLGYFNVTRAVRCLVMTGESGMGVIQETARRQCDAMGIQLADVANLLWTEDLPKFGSITHQDALARTLTENEIEAVAIDPAYLTMPGADAGNLMMQGELLRGVSEVCRACGCMMILVHHSRKNRADAFEPLALEDLAWSGFAEYARQWIGVNPRQRYQHGTGVHNLWLQYGGSAGHGGLHGLTIKQGITNGAEGRYWDVEILGEQEAREAVETSVQDERRAKREQRRREDIEEAKEAIENALRSVEGNRETLTDIQKRSGRKGKAFDEALGEMLRTGRLEECQFEKRNRQTYDGYRLVFNDGNHPE